MPAKFVVAPQRSNGIFYHDCEPARATSWAVVKVTQKKANGKSYKVHQTISRHSTRTQANGDAESMNKSHEPLPRSYRLGKRMEKLA